MRPPGYAYSGAMPGQPRPHMGMGQGNMGMPQGAMSPVMSGVGNMQAPQVCQDHCFCLQIASSLAADSALLYTCLPACVVFKHCA